MKTSAKICQRTDALLIVILTYHLIDWLAGQSFLKVDYDQALRLFRESLKLTVAIHGETDWRTVTVRVAIVNTQEKMGMTVEPLDQMEILGEQHPKTIASLKKLASLRAAVENPETLAIETH